MKKLLTLALLASTLTADVDFCQQHKNTLLNLLGQVDNHINNNRVISTCNTLDQAEYFNHRLIVQCNDQVAKLQTKRHIESMKQFYCKGIK